MIQRPSPELYESNPPLTLRQVATGLVVLVGVSILVWLILAQVPFSGILTTIKALSVDQIFFLVAINLVLMLVYNARWWVILRNYGFLISFPKLFVYRMAGYSISYFSPGPQFGGEFYQVYLLNKRQGIPSEAAFSSVLLDRILDILVNFTFLMVGLAYLLVQGTMLNQFGWGGWLAIAGILVFPFTHLYLLSKNIHPLGVVSEKISVRIPVSAISKVLKTIQHAEEKLSRVIRTRPMILVKGVLFSIGMWLLMILEYTYILSVLGLSSSPFSVITGMTAARLAYLVTPLPGGLGGYEASQVLAMEILGSEPALGIAISLIVRARDLLWGGIGVGMGGWSWWGKSTSGRVIDPKP